MELYTVIQKQQLQQGTTERGAWRSQDIIVEAQQNVQYPDRYLLHFSGSSVDKLAGIEEGMTVTAQWSANVRNYKTKTGSEVFVQELRCWKIERAPAVGGVDTLPFD